MNSSRGVLLGIVLVACALGVAAWFARSARAGKSTAPVPVEATPAAAPTAALAKTVGSITCYSDSAEGTAAAESVARLISDRGQERYYSKSFVVTEREDKDSNRYLILILSPEGDRAFEKSRQDFDDALLALLQKMKKHFGDERVEVVLQHPDKSNMMEAYFDGKGGALKGLAAPSPSAGGTVSQPAAPAVAPPQPAVPPLPAPQPPSSGGAVPQPAAPAVAPPQPASPDEPAPAAPSHASEPAPAAAPSPKF